MPFGAASEGAKFICCIIVVTDRMIDDWLLLLPTFSVVTWWSRWAEKNWFHRRWLVAVAANRDT